MNCRFSCRQTGGNLAFPDWGDPALRQASHPHQDIVSERLSTLHSLPHDVPASWWCLSDPDAPAGATDYIAASSLVLQAGQALDIDQFRRDLQRNGYLNGNRV